MLLVSSGWLVRPVASAQEIENRFTHYTAKDGLADGQIVSITQDAEGFLWLASRGGLSRFDGHDFKVFRFDPGDTNSLRENGVRDFFVDSTGGLWMITANWLHRYHPGGGWFEHFSISSVATDNLNRICREENGQLTIAGDANLYSFNIKQRRFTVFGYEGAKRTSHSDCKKDENGVLWISRSDDLIRHDPATNKSTVFDSLGGLIFLTPGNYLITVNYGYGIHIIDKRTMAVKTYVPASPDPTIGNAILSCCKLNDSTLVVGTMEGIAVFNITSGLSTFIRPDPMNPSALLEHDNLVTSIYRDREGILWFGGRHLEKYDFADFKIKIISDKGKDHREKPFYNYFSIYRCSNGNFLLGDYNSASVYEPGNDRLTRLGNKGLIGRIVDNFTEDAYGNIWCNTVTQAHFFPRICVFRLTGNAAANVREFSIPIERGIRDMKLDTRGYIYKTSRSGVVKFDTATKAFTILGSGHDGGHDLTSRMTTSICAARNGTIWVGTDKGLNKIERDGTIKRFSKTTRNIPQPDWYVTDMAEDTHGAIWMAVDDHGIGRIDPLHDSISFLTVQQGLPTNLYDKLCADDAGNLWALSNVGVLRINTQTLQNHLYTETEGFPNFDDVKDIHFSQFNKKLYLLTDYAIFELDPHSTVYTPKLPRTVITEFSVLDKERPLSSSNTISLKYNENFINIRFAALQFHSNGQIKYAYKLEGVDDDWVYCNLRRNASYTNLAPGAYTFKVKAQSPTGVWNDVPTELHITVRPPFWQTWWFNLLEVLAASLFAYAIVRLYTTRKLEVQRMEFEKQQAISLERTRIAADMHDELGAGLTSIRFLSEIANEKLHNDQVAKTEIEKIEHSAAQLSENLREIIWTMNTRFDKLDDFIIYVRTYAAGYFDDTPIQLHFISPPALPDIKIAGEVRRNIFLCIKEALHNVVKHSGATEVSISFGLSGNTLTTTIKDSGRGIDTENLNKFGNGLNTMRERLRKCGGELTIEADHGTTLILKAKIS